MQDIVDLGGIMDNQIIVEIIGDMIPKYQTPFASGCDLCADLKGEKSVTLRPGQRMLIKSGIKLKIPEGYEAQIRGRSGLAIKYGIAIVQGTGTIDSDYVGEIGALLINHGDENFEIYHGDRVAQMVFAKTYCAKFLPVEFLEETDRDPAGFGSTGVK